jgi:hypothetical protein
MPPTDLASVDVHVGGGLPLTIFIHPRHKAGGISSDIKPCGA